MAITAIVAIVVLLDLISYKENWKTGFTLKNEKYDWHYFAK